VLAYRFRRKALGDKDNRLSQGILKKARWNYMVKNATQSSIGEMLDTSVEILEEEYS